MNRVTDYMRFAMWFLGLGYIALWPVTAQDNAFAPMGLSFICGQLALPDFLCGTQAGLRLSPGLHLAGMTSSACVLICLVLRPLRRRFRGRANGSAKAMASPVARLRLGKRRAPPPPRRYVPPRSHFGLRGAPH